MIRPVDQPAALLGWMDALCDTTRLRLLCLLERNELGVAELCDIVQAPQSTVSRHLKLLAEGGWTFSRRSGTANLYRMAEEELDERAYRLWQLARDEITASPTFRHDQLRLAQLLQKRESESQRFFAGAGDQWDKLREECYGQSFMIAAMLALLPQDMVVADLGCGTAAMTRLLADHVARVIGVDNSPVMLEAATTRTRDCDNVELRQGDLEDLPLKDQECHAAILSLALTYVDDAQAVLRETYRVIKPGGKVIIVDIMRHSREDFRREMGQRNVGFEPHDMRTMLTEMGFKRVQCNPLPPEAGVKGPALMLTTGGR